MKIPNTKIPKKKVKECKNTKIQKIKNTKIQKNTNEYTKNL